MSPHLSPCLCVVLEDMACPPDDQQTAMSSVTVNTTDYSQCDYIHEERIRQVQIKKPNIKLTQTVSMYQVELNPF